MDPNITVPQLPNIPLQSNQSPGGKRKFVGIGVILLLIASVGLGLNLLSRQQKLKSKAANYPVTFVQSDKLKCDSSEKCTTSSSNIEVSLDSPLGPGQIIECAGATGKSCADGFTCIHPPENDAGRCVKIQ